MSSLVGFQKSVVPITSFAREIPQRQPVFVPEAGGRWGAPARLEFTFDTEEVEEDEDDGSIVVEENDRTILRHGIEVDIGEEVKDPKTGQTVVQGREFVCYCGSHLTHEVTSKKNGSATVKQHVFTTHKIYVDAKPWIKFMSNYGSWETTKIHLRCDECPEPPPCP